MSTVISASRRTDIPAFYMDWFMHQIQQGRFDVLNPYNRRRTVVAATPEDVHSIVFWSKDFGPFIRGNYGRRLQALGYRPAFNFTLNSDSALLEPQVPPLAERLQQMAFLGRHFDPRSVTWRFDPICFFRPAPGPLRDNLHALERIATHAGRCGISRCITSFMDLYPKIQKRLATRPGLTFSTPSLAAQKQVLLQIETILAANQIELFTCCEKAVMATLPPESRIRPAACICHRRLTELFGGNLSFKKDTGQRLKAGCGCQAAADIGSYAQQPCYHNCLFCYANPSPGPGQGRRALAQPTGEPEIHADR